MNQSLKTYSPLNLIVKALWGGTIILALFFIVKYAIQYFGFDPEVFGRYWPYRFILVGHVGGGILGLILGPFQFSKSFRNKHLSIHRLIGKIYIVAVLVASVCAIVLAFTVGMDVHWTWALSLVGLALPWITCVLMAYRSIRLRRITPHREWMIRSYIVTFGFVVFRVLDDYVMTDWGSFIERAPTEIWMSWAIPLMVAEVFIQWNKK